MSASRAAAGNPECVRERAREHGEVAIALAGAYARGVCRCGLVIGQDRDQGCEVAPARRRGATARGDELSRAHATVERPQLVGIAEFGEVVCPRHRGAVEETGGVDDERLEQLVELVTGQLRLGSQQRLEPGRSRGRSRPSGTSAKRCSIPSRPNRAIDSSTNSRLVVIGARSFPSSSSTGTCWLPSAWPILAARSTSEARSSAGENHTTSASSGGRSTTIRRSPSSSRTAPANR